jgi:hypothetical protein
MGNKNNVQVIESGLKAIEASATELEKVSKALELMGDGHGLVASCKAVGMALSRFNRIIVSSDFNSKLYYLSQVSRAEVIADEVITIADDEDRCPIQARNAIEARKWYASKINPRKYGDRIEVELTEKVDLSAAILEAKNRVMHKK